MASKFLRLSAALSAVAATAGLIAFSAGAQVLDRTIETENRIQRSAAQTQDQIDQVAEETEDLVTQYRRVVSETNSLRVYNDNLQSIVDDQEAEMESINEQLATLEKTNRDVVPLMIEMLDMVERLIESDIPFRREERLAQVEVLRDAMDDADVTASEKYRRIMEAYQNEIELGRTTEGYTSNLPSGQRVNFLRIGRTMLYYQTLDGQTTGWYNTDSGQFEELGDEYRLPVSDGLAIAQNQTAPDLVRLPVPAPKSAQ